MGICLALVVALSLSLNGLMDISFSCRSFNSAILNNALRSVSDQVAIAMLTDVYIFCGNSLAEWFLSGGSSL